MSKEDQPQQASTGQQVGVGNTSNSSLRSTPRQPQGALEFPEQALNTQVGDDIQDSPDADVMYVETFDPGKKNNGETIATVVLMTCPICRTNTIMFNRARCGICGQVSCLDCSHGHANSHPENLAKNR